jgi:hypothetical protein
MDREGLRARFPYGVPAGIAYTIWLEDYIIRLENAKKESKCNICNGTGKIGKGDCLCQNF